MQLWRVLTLDLLICRRGTQPCTLCAGNDQQSEHKTRSHYHKHTSSGSSGGSGAAGYGANSAYSAAPVAVPHQEPERQQPHQTSSASRLIPGGPCFSCGITEAPQWRRPDPGTMLLCNRCGIHYMRYRKLPGEVMGALWATDMHALCAWCYRLAGRHVRDDLRNSELS